MKKLMIFFLIVTTPIFGQDTTLIKYLIKTEEKELFQKLDAKIDSLTKLKYEGLENKISSNELNIDSIKNKKPEKKQNSWTDKMKAITALFTGIIAVPAALLSIYNFYSQKIKRLNELEEYFKVMIQGLYKLF